MYFFRCFSGKIKRAIGPRESHKILEVRLMLGCGARSKKLVRRPLSRFSARCGSSSNCFTYRFSAPDSLYLSAAATGNERLHDDVHTLLYVTVMLAAIAITRV